MKTQSIKSKFKAEYEALKNAIDRTTRPNHPQYDDYGGRGIAVSEEYLCPKTGFIAFMADIGRKPDSSFTLDRIDNNKGYCSGNIAWRSRSQNQLNRRKSAPRDLGWGTVKSGSRTSPLISHKGQIMTVRKWSEVTGLSVATIVQRLQRGWTVEEALCPILRNPWNRPRIDQSHIKQ